MTYNFDLKIPTPKFTVEVSTAELYGWYEHDDLGDEAGGGLWFEIDTSAPDGNLRLELVDYDGMAILPKPIVTSLRANGILVSEDFE
jgi:hypothetical protein